MPTPTIVITSIATNDNPVLQNIAQESICRGYNFIVIGDVSSPTDFSLSGCDFYGIERQLQLGFEFPKLCPTKIYGRKNIGYLIAAKKQAPVIIETDDDNFPREDFWKTRVRIQSASVIKDAGWVNAYSYFTKTNVWPRGLPLNAIKKPLPSWKSLDNLEVDSPIQQGLADEDPDVDAIYRLVSSKLVRFRTDRTLALATNSWCPFNSQNTTWWQDAYPLMYLPTSCSFRLTDIWRSFIAQRIAWVNNWSIIFHSPTVWQERNEHNLMQDFADEVPGYLNNFDICKRLTKLKLISGTQHIQDNMRLCYKELIAMGLIKPQELDLLNAWLGDLKVALCQ